MRGCEWCDLPFSELSAQQGFQGLDVRSINPLNLDPNVIGHQQFSGGLSKWQLKIGFKLRRLLG